MAVHCAVSCRVSQMGPGGQPLFWALHHQGHRGTLSPFEVTLVPLMTRGLLNWEPQWNSWWVASWPPDESSPSSVISIMLLQNPFVNCCHLFSYSPWTRVRNRIWTVLLSLLSVCLLFSASVIQNHFMWLINVNGVLSVDSILWHGFFVGMIFRLLLINFFYLIPLISHLIKA